MDTKEREKEINSILGKVVANDCQMHMQMILDELAFHWESRFWELYKLNLDGMSPQKAFESALYALNEYKERIRNIKINEEETI